MLLKSWEKLPDMLRIDEVRPYYDTLRRKSVSLLLKRAVDVVCSLLMLCLLSPLFAVLALAVKLDSPGPVFFRQTRITQYGRTFRIFKFRTMVSDADRRGGAVTLLSDARITRVGARIRHLRLDEIPQLINVLFGQMSFVGTRPEVLDYVRRYSPEMRATLLLPAGITSTASVEFRDEDTLLQAAEQADEVYVRDILPQKMAYNLEDLRRFSLWRDLRILLRTVTRVFGQRKARTQETETSKSNDG